MSDWQPIETAPRDGADVLAWNGKDFGVIHWDETLPACQFNGKWADHTDEYMCCFAPTHWKPLEPPQ